MAPLRPVLRRAPRVGHDDQRGRRASRPARALTLVSLLLAGTTRAEGPASFGSDTADDERALDAAARAPASEVELAPSARGGIGAWLVVGPYPATSRPFDAPPAGVDPSTLAPVLGARVGAARWQIGASGEGPVDLLKLLAVRGRRELVAYAAGMLHVARAGRHHLLLGVDDGVRVRVDGKVVYTRDEARPLREDDDVVPLDLDRGEHTVVLELHQRDGAWAFRARLVDATLAPAAGAFLRLPGTTADDALALARRMSWASLDRAFDATSEPATYRPSLTVRFPEGAPRGVPLTVAATLAGAFDVRAGAVPITARGVGEVVVALPPIAPGLRDRALDIDVAGRTVRPVLLSRPRSEAALVRAARALARTPDDAPFLAPGSRTSIEHLASRLARLVARGDADAEAQAEEARELDALSALLESGADPYAERTGPMRRALRSPIDGGMTELGLYVPPGFAAGRAAGRTYPLVVGLHGLNGRPLAMMRVLFGNDDPRRDSAWKDRHVGALPPVDAFVVTPSGRGNTMYRELGEEDVAAAVDWVKRTFPIDPTRVTITGPSMGGIGAASLPLHRPHLFAAAAPLCGYHSLFVRRDVAGHPIRPWERFLAEERSNAFWAENGEHLPLYVVHGTRDLPVENSGVLIDRYEKLGYPVRHEQPELGHDVWRTTYAGLAGMTWLLGKKLDPAPSHVRFKTTRTRWSKSAWVTVDELSAESGWGEVDAWVRGRARIVAKTTGVSALTFALDRGVLDDGEIAVEVDGRALTFAGGEPLSANVPDGAPARAWEKGPARRETPVKRGFITGPLRDVFFEPILFVHSAAEHERRAAEEVARSFARVLPGVTVSYPIMSDAEFIARGEPLANERALFLVGRDNRVLADLERLRRFPVRVEAGGVVIGAERIEGKEVGAAFIHPNPARADRYVVVVAGVDVPGTLRATSLPLLAPDFVVWDAGMARARGQLLLGAGAARAAGLFRKDWSLPDTLRDPLAGAVHPGARDERDATPSLP